MNLLEKIGMIKVYCKNLKKSIYIPWRIDVFLILAFIILIISPFLISIFTGKKTENKQAVLYLSPEFDEWFGSEITEALLTEYARLHPEFKIKILPFPDDRDSTEGREPDILLFDDGGYTTFVTGSLLLNLDPGFSNQLAVPLVSFMDLFFYNIEILTAAGLDRPPKTREEFLATARDILNSSNPRLSIANSTAFSLGTGDKYALSRDLFSWIWAAGSDFWSEENIPVLNIRDITGDITFFRNLYREYLLAPGIFETTGEQRLDEFARGRIGMMVASSRAIPYLREKMGDDKFGITNIPGTGSTGKYNISLSGIYAGINADCEYPHEALDFLEFLAGQSQLFCEIFNAVPGVVSDIIPGNYVRDDPFYSKAWDIFESSVIIRNFTGRPGAQEYESAFLEELRSFFDNNRTPLETVNAIQKRWDEVLP